MDNQSVSAAAWAVLGVMVGGLINLLQKYVELSSSRQSDRENRIVGYVIDSGIDPIIIWVQEQKELVLKYVDKTIPDNLYDPAKFPATALGRIDYRFERLWSDRLRNIDRRIHQAIEGTQRISSDLPILIETMLNELYWYRDNQLSNPTPSWPRSLYWKVRARIKFGKARRD